MSSSGQTEFRTELEEPDALSPAEVARRFDPWDEQEIGSIEKVARQMPGLQAAFQTAENNFSDDEMDELVGYAVRYIPPVYQEFMRNTLLQTAQEAQASPDDSGLSQRINQQIAGAASVSAGKRAIDRVIKGRLGVGRVNAPVLAVANNVLDMIPGDQEIPYPRLRLDAGDQVAEPALDRTVSLENTSRVTIRPVTKQGEPIGAAGQPTGIVAGPRAEATDPITIETVFRGENGLGGTVAHVLYRFLVFFFVSSGCAMAAASYYERIWIPVLLHLDQVKGTERQPITFTPDRDQLLACRFQPIGKNLSSAAIRVVE